MGFKTGAYATVFAVEPDTEKHTRVRLSISYKDKMKDAWVQDFGGFVDFYGAECAGAAKKLNEKDRIKLGDVDVSRRWAKDEGKEYIYYKVFSFEMADGSGSTQKPKEVDADEFDGDSDDLPF